MKMRTIKTLLIAATLFVARQALADSLTVKIDTTISSDTTFEFVRITATGRLTMVGVLTVTKNMVIDSGGILRHVPQLALGLRLQVADTLRIRVGGAIEVNGRGLRGGGGSGSQFGGRGETYDSTTNTIVAGPDDGRGVGGSYGGLALAAPNVAYGFFENPTHLGSGGSACNYGGNGGGLIHIDAGTILLNGVIQADGTNGGSCVFGGGGGGGSGGGIRIGCDKLSGIGNIYARGGNPGNTNPTCGGGGRIAIFCDDMSGFALSRISASSGTIHNRGSAGTIFIRNSRTDSTVAGELIIDNDNGSSSAITPYRSAVQIIKAITIQQLGHLEIGNTAPAIICRDLVKITESGILTLASGASLTIEKPTNSDLLVSGAGRLNLNDGALLNLTSLQVTDNSSLVESRIALDFTATGDAFLLRNQGQFVNYDTLKLRALNQATLNGGILVNHNLIDLDNKAVVLVSGSRLVENAKLTPSDSVASVVIDSGAVLTHSEFPLNSGSGLRLIVGNTLHVKAGGKIDATGQGLRGAGGSGSQFGSRGETYDPSSNTIVAGPDDGRGIGGSYGGLALGAPNVAYGFFENPAHFGSGGSGCNYGGNGGGLIQIDAGTIILDGTIQADGTSGGNCVFGAGGGGGSGGGIRISCNRLSGAGRILARGGNLTNRNPTSGGGGRIAILCDDLSGFALNQISTLGGLLDKPAAAGTIFIRNSRTNNALSGDLIVDNEGTYTSATTPGRTALTAIRNLIIRNYGALDLTHEIAVENNLSVSTGGGIGRQ